MKAITQYVRLAAPTLILFSLVIRLVFGEEVNIVRLDPRFDQTVPKDAVLEKVAYGFTWLEGPVWNGPGGFLLFSDVPNNSILKWKQDEGVSLFLKPSGYTGPEAFHGKEPGSNGLTYDSKGRLVFCQHGNRRIVRLENDGSQTTLADNYMGKRLNSPNDLVFKSNGDLYFTDPPFGLPKSYDDPQRELDFSGVYRVGKDGKVTLLTRELKGPNGIAFSPDEKILYVTDSLRGIWMAFDARDDGAVANGRVLYALTEAQKSKPGGADGMKVDMRGNIFGAAPGGVYIFAPDGKQIGIFDLGTATGNCAWGEDGSVLFITSSQSIYRIKLNTKGAPTW